MRQLVAARLGGRPDAAILRPPTRRPVITRSALLTARDLTLARPPLGPVDLDLYGGEVALLTGESGSGKSRLLRALADLDTPEVGRLTLEGYPVSELKPAAYRARVAYLPANPQLGSGPAGALLEWLAGFRHRADGDGNAPWLRRLGLPDDIRDRPLEGLSTGEVVRFTLALLLAGEPAVLLLDEPTAPLDPRRTAAVEQVVAERAAAGTAVLWVSHTPEQAARLGHRLYRVRDGALEGPFTDPQTYAALMPTEEAEHDP